MLAAASRNRPELTGAPGPAICGPERRKPGEGPQLRARRCWETCLAILDGRTNLLHPELVIRTAYAVAGHGSCESKECQLKLRCTYGRDLNDSPDLHPFRFRTQFL